LGDDAGFAEESLRLLFAPIGRSAEDLEGDLVPKAQIARTEDDAHSAAGDEPLDAISRSNHLPRLRDGGVVGSRLVAWHRCPVELYHRPVTCRNARPP